METYTVIGLIAATCTTFSFLPQAIKTLKTKQADDLSLTMYTFLTVGAILWLVYGILIKEMPIILANGIALFFVIPTLIMKIRYK